MDAATLAAINQRAVLRTLAHLPELDPETATLTSGDRVTIQFKVPGLATSRLVIGGGTIGWFDGNGPSTISPLFPKPQMLDKMFEGTGLPIPVKGATKLKYLTGTLTAITDRLTYFLRPTPEALEDPEYTRINTIPALHLASYAMAEIANHDEAGQAIASRMPDGAVVLSVEDGPALTLVMRDHVARVHDGRDPNRRSMMIFKDLQTAGQVLRGELPAFTAIGRQQLELGGYVPLLDEMNKLLAIVPRYMS